MRIRGLAGVGLAVSIVGWSTAAFAQVRTPNVFGDASVSQDYDATNHATGVAAAAGFGVGLQWSKASSLRFERDMPRWHEARAVAPQVRTITNAILYGRHFDVAPRMNLALLLGGTATEQIYSTLPHTNGWLAATFGGDAQIAITPHLAIVPGIRYYKYFSYESWGGSITRPRFGVRVRF